MRIPQAVSDKAKDLIEVYGNNIMYIGNCNNKDVFRFLFPKNERTGFPYVYLYDSQTNTAEEITGIQAMKYIRRLSSYNI